MSMEGDTHTERERRRAWGEIVVRIRVVPMDGDVQRKKEELETCGSVLGCFFPFFSYFFVSLFSTTLPHSLSAMARIVAIAQPDSNLEHWGPFLGLNPFLLGIHRRNNAKITNFP